MILPFFVIEKRNEIYGLLGERRLREAFVSLRKLLIPLQQWDLSESLVEIERSYQFMIRYMLDGVHDPERDRVYHKLVLSAYGLTDRIVDGLFMKDSSWLYYSQRRYMLVSEREPLNSRLERADGLFGTLSLQGLLGEQRLGEGDVRGIRQELDGMMGDLFLELWTGPDPDRVVMESALAPNHFPTYFTGLLVSALTLRLACRYDEGLLRVLLSATQSDDPVVSQRALVGSILLIHKFGDRVWLSPSLMGQLASYAEDRVFRENVRTVYLQFIKSRDTEKISRKLHDEILPEMMRISPSLYNKIKSDDLFSDPESGDPNPEWQELLDQAGISDKLKELTDLQMEGADVFLSTFAGLKNFSFFKSLSNWFMPFYPENPALGSFFPADGSLSSLEDILTHSSFLCNSDKYSFCLSLEQIPESQRSLILSQFDGEGEQMKALEKEEAFMKRKGGRSEIISNQYIQDLYRFFKLHPRSQEFQNPFNQPLRLDRLPALKGFFDDRETLHLIAEYFFKKGHYDDALELFLQLSQGDGADCEIYQKTGYCYQMQLDYETALAFYLKADILCPDSAWTVRRIALCYRSLKNSERALEYYLRAGRLLPDNFSIQMNIGHCFLERKRYDEALGYYFKVEYLDQGSDKSWRPIAWCSFLVGKYEQSQRYYDRILGGKPTAQDFLNAGHVAFASGGMRRAVDCYMQSIVLDGGGLETFVRNFRNDVPELIAAGIPVADIPVLLDQLSYSLDE